MKREKAVEKNLSLVKFLKLFNLPSPTKHSWNVSLNNRRKY